MKKLLILSSVSIIMAFLFTGLTTAQTVDKSTLVGTWQLCDDSGKLVTTGNVRIKVITTESFTVSEINQDKKTFSAFFIGNYSLKNSVYTETITYTNTQLQTYIGQSNNFNIELRGEQLYLKGQGNPYNEIWQRISK